ncbi:fructose-specific PTS transporter subunit EIIC [Corynebacterium sanguinis]|uniref:PTS fructose transporter subunit IIABC n=1 Tax=Corynebacterium sanguinis TaxID=2594913 RepID=UPI0021AF0A38|nr:fructose-specific PTS transporter subunit EIIC [Corynebacterium sanguinis]MCT1426288.1 fructose-specific PTS transporter subunit EIIC [Corynebacterium sanguinis]
MDSPDLIRLELVALDVDAGGHPREVIAHLAGLVESAGRTNDSAQLIADVTAREGKAPTGVAGRIAIPHARSSAVSVPTLAFARLRHPVDFSGPDGPADLVFLIAAPADGSKAHLSILSTLARALVREQFVEKLRAATDPQAAVEAIAAQLNHKKKRRRIAVVTACPTGVAHTYMAADALARAAASRDDVELRVEAQGATGTQPLDPDFIRGADAVILAHDVAVRGAERFEGKPLVHVPVRRAINEPAQLIDAVLNATETSTEPSTPARIYRAVMTGVSFMVPFLAASGLLLALGTLIGGTDVWAVVARGFSLADPHGGLDRSGWLPYLAAVLIVTGQAGINLAVSALSGYIGFALAGRAGIAPGFIGGAVSVMLGAGFLGAVVTGIVAGGVALWIRGINARALESLKTTVVSPLVATLAVLFLMVGVIGRPFAALSAAVQGWLGEMGSTSAILLGVVVGAMMCVDLGGPVNKVAYAFGAAGLTAGTQASYVIMAAVMVSGMVPPLALSLATLLRASAFTPAERAAGRTIWLPGLAFVTEGAIPFAAADPARVITPLMLGGATAGAVSMALGTGVSAPHGGIFVIFAFSPWWGVCVALASGVAVGALAVVVAKQAALGRRKVST